LKQNPDNKAKYPKMKNVNVDTVDVATSDPGFEAVAAAYLKVFDDVITAVEEKPADVSDACSRLNSVGKMHRSKVSECAESSFGIYRSRCMQDALSMKNISFRTNERRHHPA
uniref:Globin (inferred by orthology to a C. elegans protein) n=1 Tax=Anisakis simplex TaxID=6269 RepID=A0A0M3J115_ANISI